MRYREAVSEHSPGLPRFAATLGTELSNDPNPKWGWDRPLNSLSRLRDGGYGSYRFEACVSIVDDPALLLHQDLACAR